MTDQPLKACPFCGGDPIKLIRAAGECNRCDSFSVNWNTRPTEARLRSDLDAAIEALEFYEKDSNYDEGSGYDRGLSVVQADAGYRAAEALTKIRGDK